MNTAETLSVYPEVDREPFRMVTLQESHDFVRSGSPAIMPTLEVAIQKTNRGCLILR
jgi:hypothetical protein